MGWGLEGTELPGSKRNPSIITEGDQDHQSIHILGTKIRRMEWIPLPLDVGDEMDSQEGLEDCSALGIRVGCWTLGASGFTRRCGSSGRRALD